VKLFEALEEELLFLVQPLSEVVVVVLSSTVTLSDPVFVSEVFSCAIVEPKDAFTEESVLISADELTLASTLALTGP
jgi:hypothetical protein